MTLFDGEVVVASVMRPIRDFSTETEGENITWQRRTSLSFFDRKETT